MENFIKRLALAATFLCAASVGYAGYGEVSNQKAHCVVLKNNKVVHQQSCLYDRKAIGNVWSSSYSTKIKKIKGYGNFNIEYYSKSLVVNDDFVYDSDGQIVNDEESVTLNVNGKPAYQRYRMPKTLKVLTKAQVARYERGDGDSIQPYECYYRGRNASFELCYR